MDLYSRSAYHYELPEELIAQHPITPRDASRLMIIKRETGEITESTFGALYDILHSGDGLIFNDTRVVPARLLGTRKHGGKTEVFLTRRHPDGTWDALLRPAKKVPPGAFVEFNARLSCEVIEVLADGERRIRFHCEGDIDTMLEECGQIPLPHYIKRQPDRNDRSRYQTVFAANAGALAAPTAGLHFTEELLSALSAKGISQTRITLHTGLGTFKPVKTEDIRLHHMHTEQYEISEDVALWLNSAEAKKGTQICVGTTCCRALESACTEEGVVKPGRCDTNIFIYPGYRFRYVKHLLTNFHLPGSTLLMLVSAFAGYDLMMEAYARAVKERFRFFSYGDAMLIL